MINQSELRLSAQRALLGCIHREIRLVKVQAMGASIVLSVVVDCEPSGLIREDISDAAAEIIADFPEAAKNRREAGSEQSIYCCRECCYGGLGLSPCGAMKARPCARCTRSQRDCVRIGCLHLYRGKAAVRNHEPANHIPATSVLTPDVLSQATLSV